jgi:cytochrome P450
MAESSTLETWVGNHLPIFFSVLRVIKPNLVIKGKAFITRYDDVKEVLSNNVAFHAPYAEKMRKVTAGNNFFLGMQQTADYTRDTSNMRLTVRREDLNSRIIPFVEKTANALFEKQKKHGKMDFVTDLSRYVPTRLVGDYFGTPGWDEVEFTDAMTSLFEYLFYPDDPELETRALLAAKQSREYLDSVIADRVAQREQRDDVIERCLQMQDANLPGMSNLDIRNNLIGLLIGAIPTTSKVAALTLDYLLDHPEQLSLAQAAAHANDIEKINRIALEVMRFNPFAPGIKRIAAEDYVVAQGHFRSTKIPKGTDVIAATASAHMDWRRFKQPKKFRLDRPEYLYMHYGFSLHTCFGQYINAVQIPRILQVILKQTDLCRVADSKMQLQGPFPSALKVKFKA